MQKLVMMGWECCRCGHKWIPKKKGVTPVVCPKCKSPYYNKKMK